MEGGWVKFLGADDTLRLLETDIGVSGGIAIIDPRRGYWTPKQLTGDIGGGTIYYLDDDIPSAGIRELDPVFPNSTEWIYSRTLFMVSTWYQFPNGYKFQAAAQANAHTPVNYWKLKIAAKVSNDIWTGSTEKAYLKWIAKVGSTELCNGSTRIYSTYAEYEILSNGIPLSLAAGDLLDLYLYIGYFNSTPS